MKKILAMILAAGAGFAVAAIVISTRLAMRHAAQLAEHQAAWYAEKAEIEAALEEAKARSRFPNLPEPPAPAAPLAGPTKLSPAEIVAKLRALKFPSANQTRTARQTIYWLEELISAGPASLPVIREFLALNEDMEFNAGDRRGGRGGVPGDFVLPPSLRFGLFDVVKQIGGPDAETILAEVLVATGRGVELAWLARALEQIAPNQYRDTALAAARQLLGQPIDRAERDQLFGLLTLYGDTSYAATAQAQLLRADGQVDRGALRYLQQSLGQQAVPIAAQWYDDPRITEPAQKEPFARLALNFVGVDAQANQFYERAINDLTLTPNHRENLIEDLNEDGFTDRRNLTARDLPLIENRIALIEQLAPNAADAVNAAAFKEAYKDLLNMRARITNPPKTAP